MSRTTRTYYDAFAQGYERGRDRGYHRLIDDLEAEVTRPHVRNARVLEAGCGTGLVLERLARDAAEVVGADLSAGMLAKARGRGLPVVQADILALPFPDATFDAAACFKVLPHIPDTRAAVAEIARVVRPGGVVVLEFYNKWSLRHLIRRARPSLKTSHHFDEGAIPTAFHSPREVAALLPAGAEVLEMRGIRGFTLLPDTLRLPLVGPALTAGERAFTRGPLSRFGGFLVVVARVA